MEEKIKTAIISPSVCHPEIHNTNIQRAKNKNPIIKSNKCLYIKELNLFLNTNIKKGVVNSIQE